MRLAVVSKQSFFYDCRHSAAKLAVVNTSRHAHEEKYCYGNSQSYGKRLQKAIY